MPDIHPELLIRLRKTLLNCSQFTSNPALKTVFVDARISPWRDMLPLPDIGSSRDRVNVTIDYLSKEWSNNDENALVLFLHVLSDYTNLRSDCHHELVELASILKYAIPKPNEIVEPSQPASTPFTPDKLINWGIIVSGAVVVVLVILWMGGVFNSDTGEETSTLPLTVRNKLTITPESKEIPTPTRTSTLTQISKFPTITSSPTLALLMTYTPDFQLTSTPTKDISTNFCPPLGSPNAMFSTPLTAMGKPISMAGTGIFTNVVQPYGTKKTPYRYIKDAVAENCVQFISTGTLLDSQSSRDCMVSQYHTNRIWLNIVKSGALVLVKSTNSENFEIIGRMDKVPPDVRGYVVEYELQVGDEICWESPDGITMGDIIQAGGYHLWIGRDIMVFLDSYCMMLENDGSQYWCP